MNHSSDVDLIFVYSDEGQLSAQFSYHEWFTRLGNKIIETFATSDPAGSLFRIDLRLRPEGSAGPLVRSLESMENYYAGFGEIWERLALIKARWICGDRELAYDFLRQLQPFIFPKSPTPDLLDDVAAIKARIERDIVGHEERERNVKLGVGGIREIEFVVQALQLLHAARHPFLQEPGTLRAIRGLAELDFCLTKTRTGSRQPIGFCGGLSIACKLKPNSKRTPCPKKAKPSRGSLKVSVSQGGQDCWRIA